MKYTFRGHPKAVSDSVFKLMGQIKRIEDGKRKSNLLATQHRARKINQARFELSSAEAVAMRKQGFVIPLEGSIECSDKVKDGNHYRINVENYLWYRVQGASQRLTTLMLKKKSFEL